MEGKRDYSNNKYSPCVILKVSDRQGRYLFVKETSGKFGLPKESVYPGEFSDMSLLDKIIFKAHKIANDLGFEIVTYGNFERIKFIGTIYYIFTIITDFKFKVVNQECKWLSREAYNGEVLNDTKFNKSIFFVFKKYS